MYLLGVRPQCSAGLYLEQSLGSRKWANITHKAFIESLGGDFGGSPQQVTAGTRQGARTKTSATPAFLAPRSSSHPLRP